MTELDPREAAALDALARRRRRAKVGTLLPFLVLGIVVGAVGYAVVRDWQFAMTDQGGGHGLSFPVISGVGFILPFVVLAGIGEVVARRVVRRRTPRWIEQVARDHGMPASALASVAELLAD
ncbi:MAG: hypothetical protein KC731_29335 [Myxococcales bacterium]|nr:hypothetical protein [Myxococcales bacterium]